MPINFAGRRRNPSRSQCGVEFRACEATTRIQDSGERNDGVAVDLGQRNCAVAALAEDPRRP